VTRCVKTVLSFSVSQGGAFFQGRPRRRLVTAGLQYAARCVTIGFQLIDAKEAIHQMTVSDQIEREVVIDAPVERVWELVTEAEHLGRWFGDAGAEVDLRPGGAMALRWSEYGTSRGRIEAVEPHRLFAFRWAPFKDPGGLDPTEGNSTRVEFTLSAEGRGTRLRVVESGFALLDTSDEQRRENLDGNTEGWRIELGELQEYATRVAA
jgi:uncharacterized protein YndB with AHSA1/START domain